MATDTGPRAGDVVFTFSSDKDGWGSCLLQRLVFDRFSVKWFSHVAVALTDNIVIEANTEPEADEVTWSGVDLGRGVRLRLLPDLIFAAANFAVLRHPSALTPETYFTITQPHILQLFGSGYSTAPLLHAAQSASSVLAAVVPAESFDWTAAPDAIAATLRNDPLLRAKIESRLTGETMPIADNYFCSQLSGLLLWRGGLIDNDPGNITPCGLYDLLVGLGWQDVTESDYGANTLTSWSHIDRSSWQAQYYSLLAFAKVSRDQLYSSAMLNLASEAVGGASQKLESLAQKMTRLRD